MYVLFQTIIMNTCGTVGFIANSLVIAVLVKFTSFQEKPSMQFILMQSVIDALSSLGIIFNNRNFGFNLKLVQISYPDNAAGYALCYLWGGNMFMASMFQVSTFNLVILTMERYFKIVYPFRYMKSFRKWKLRVALFLPWVIGFLYQLGVHLPHYKIIGNECWSIYMNYTYAQEVSLAVGDLMVTFIIPITIMGFCYLKIFFALKQSSKRFKEHTGKSESVDTDRTTSNTSLSQDTGSAVEISSISLGNLDGKSHTSSSTSLQKVNGLDGGNKTAASRQPNHELKISKSEKKVVKTLVVVTVCFFLCWIGRQALFFIDSFIKNERIFDLFDDFVITMAFLNSVINPFIYVITLSEYRKSLWKKLRGK